MKKYIYISLFIISIIACTSDSKVKNIEIQGHRGTRGYAPENTIPGFLKAIELGVDVLEMDVVISADNQVIVSHEPWFNHKICTKPDGTPSTIEEEDAIKIRDLNYAQIRQYDCGKRGNPDYPEQQKIAAFKPLLQDVFRTIEMYLKEKNLPSVAYNIEIKSRPMWDEVFTPLPTKFAQLLYDEVKKAELKERVCIQSFDTRSLQALHEIDASMTTALLVSNNDGIDQNLKTIGFTPTIYSPNHILLNASEIRHLQEKNIRVIPWTVNEKTHIRRLIKWGVDGIISDYPDRVTEVLNES